MVEELALLERAVPTSPTTARTNMHPGFIFLTPFRATPESDNPSSSNATSFPSCSRAATSFEIVRSPRSDTKGHRSKMADMFLTNEMPSMGRASTSSGVAPLARARVGSLSPAAALSAPPLSGTPATSESRRMLLPECRRSC